MAAPPPPLPPCRQPSVSPKDSRMVGILDLSMWSLWITDTRRADIHRPLINKHVLGLS